MKQVRLACLLVSFTFLIARPQLVPAASCCHDFSLWCDGFCYDHGGVDFCFSKIGGGCSDVCMCHDGHQYWDHSGLCPPCEE
jgi:hypothetical protein